MLTPKQVDDYAAQAAARFDPLINSILRDMARRISRAGQWTSSSEWQLHRMRELGASTQYLLQQIQAMAVSPQVAAVFARAMIAANAADAERYTDAGEKYTALGDSPIAQQIVNSGFRRTMNTLQNLTQTRAVMRNQNMAQTQQAQLARLLDQAHMQVASGAFSIDQAVRAAIGQLADEGLGAITYPSGHVDKLDTVVMRAMRTGINQTAGDISLYNAQQSGCDLMELSAHSGARTGDGGPNMTNHSWWQGRVVSLSGRPGYLSLEDIGYGDVRGFMGANCRHNWYPFFEGASVRNWTDEQLEALNAPTIAYNGKKLTEAEADAIQRALERAVRRHERAFLLYGDVSDHDGAAAAAARLARARRALDDFLRQTGGRHQFGREVVPGFNRATADRASRLA